MAEQIMRRLALPLALIRPVRALVRLHDRPLRGIHEGDRTLAERSVRRLLARMEELCEGEGPALAHELIVLKQADALAHAAPYRGWAAELEEARRIIRGVIAEQGAFSIRDLAISGQDVMDALGIESGPRVGEVLRELLGDVIEGKLPNKRDALLAHICK